MPSATLTSELQTLFDAACSDRLSNDQFAALQSRLLADDEACGLYLDYCTMHSEIYFVAGAARAEVRVHGSGFGVQKSSRHTPCAETEAEKTSVVSSPLSVMEVSPSASLPLTTNNGQRTSSPIPQSAFRIPQSNHPSSLSSFRVPRSLADRPLLFSIVVASVTTVVALLTFSQIRVGAISGGEAGIAKSVNPITFVAQFTGDQNCAWDEDDWDAPILGAHLWKGQEIELRDGVAEFTFKSGAKALVEGPATFVVEGENLGRLSLGRLVARINEKSKGFTVKTPTAEVVDLGTEFAVEVRPDGQVDVGVLKGSVALHYAEGEADDSNRNPVFKRLLAGESIRVGRNGSQTLPLDQNERLADLPNFDRRRPEGIALGKISPLQWGEVRLVESNNGIVSPFDGKEMIQFVRGERIAEGPPVCGFGQIVDLAPIRRQIRANVGLAADGILTAQVLAQFNRFGATLAKNTSHDNRFVITIEAHRGQPDAYRPESALSVKEMELACDDEAETWEPLNVVMLDVPVGTEYLVVLMRAFKASSDEVADFSGHYVVIEKIEVGTGGRERQNAN